jgi:glycosyltransferase involved in cell wall biosynthesis
LGYHNARFFSVDLTSIYKALYSGLSLYFSTSREESLGLSMLEALYLGKPVIALNSGGPSLFINETNGLLINSTDINSISSALNNFIENKFHHSDPKKAHNVCQLRDCHVFYNAKLHKCNLTYAVPNANQQLDLKLNADAIDLLEQYRPMEADWSYEKKKEFLFNINQEIPQCALCTEKPLMGIYHSASK